MGTPLLMLMLVLMSLVEIERRIVNRQSRIESLHPTPAANELGGAFEIGTAA